MTLMTKEDAKMLPPLYSTENIPMARKKVHIKFFSIFSNWTWYVVEGQQREDGDFLFFGLVDGLEREWGYFTLRELESAKAMRGKLPLVEKDLYFKPTTIKKLGLV